MRLKFWQHEKPAPVSCPRCSQLVQPDALECPMCGLDLRELYEPTPITQTEQPRPGVE